jgi:hypothetical protein
VNARAERLAAIRMLAAQPVHAQLLLSPFTLQGPEEVKRGAQTVSSNNCFNAVSLAAYQGDLVGLAPDENDMDDDSAKGLNPDSNGGRGYESCDDAE